mmetsp:Transcript_57695/g.161848  ORF Transcript_57695/g.161848 Transcript_57695/m.161848 type:complete len:430 (-) Transcript_57695:36-1325(-)
MQLPACLAEFPPIATVRAVLVQDVAPRVDQVRTPVTQHGEKLLLGVVAGLRNEERHRLPPVEEVEVRLDDRLGPHGIQAVKELLDRALEAVAGKAVPELVEIDLPRTVAVQGTEERLGAAKGLVDEYLEARHDHGARGVQLVQGHETAVIPVENLPHDLHVPVPTDVHASLEELRLVDSRRVLGEGRPPSPEEAPVLPLQVGAELGEQSRSVDLDLRRLPHLLLHRFGLCALLPPHHLPICLQPPKIVHAENAIALGVQTVEDHVFERQLPSRFAHALSELIQVDGQRLGGALPGPLRRAQPAQHVFRAVECGGAPLSETSPYRGLRLVDLVEREHAGPVGVEDHEKLRPVRKAQVLHSRAELELREPLVVVGVEVPQPSSQGRALPLLQKRTELPGGLLGIHLLPQLRRRLLLLLRRAKRSEGRQRLR